MNAESPAADMGHRGGKTERFARGYMWKLWQGAVVLFHPLFFLTNSLPPSLFCDESWKYQYIKYKWHVGTGWNSAKHLTAAEVAKNEEQKSSRFTSPKCKQHLFKLPHKDQLSSFKDITKTFKLHNSDEKIDSESTCCTVLTSPDKVDKNSKETMVTSIKDWVSQRVLQILPRGMSQRWSREFEKHKASKISLKEVSLCAQKPYKI